MKDMSLIAKITFITLLMLVLCVTSIGVFSHVMNRNVTIELSSEKALAIATSVASVIDPEQFSETIRTLEKNEYWEFVREYAKVVLEKNDLVYLYILDKSYTDEVLYFTEGYPTVPREDEPELELGDTEVADAYNDEMFEAIDTGIGTKTGLYDIGGYGATVSGFAPILDENGNVLGVVGADIGIDNVLLLSNQFILFVVIFILAVGFIAGFIIVTYLRRSVGKPLAELVVSARKISVGNVNVSIKKTSDDEIGKLVDAFNLISDSAKNQAQMFSVVAAGDLTCDITPRSDKDIINIAITSMTENLNSMFTKINDSTLQVAAGSKHVSDGAQLLANGSAEQSSSIEGLSRSISEMGKKTKENAETASSALLLAETISGKAEKGSRQMDEMISAVAAINEASQSISNVIKVIDDIAFQTNILALNAAVEAARAGVYGKGFGVVADEVRNLASKSAEAARHTGEMIQNSMAKAEFGRHIAAETAASLVEIVSGIEESSRLISDIAESSEAQSISIMKINTDIEQVTQVVYQNSATAEESAAVSEEMSGQALLLQNLVSQFKLK